MELLDSRRLTGANAISDGPGAVIDVAVDDAHAATLIRRWRDAARRILTAVGWPRERLHVRRCEGGLSLALSAPIDALYAATEVNEWAWRVAAGEEYDDLETAAARLKKAIDEERRPALLALEDAALERGLVFLSDDDEASIGLGRHSRTWPVEDLPAPGAVPWEELGDVPVGLITGTNGKTTSARLASAIAQAAGLHVGYSSTDGVLVDGVLVEQGDYAGPEGARTVLRNRGVDIAILETARGGLLRRGIGVPRATAALITRIARDHLGDFGSRNLDELLDAKWVVTRALGRDGRLVLNADDERLVARMGDSPAPVVLFSLDAGNAVVGRHVAAGGEAWVLRDGQLCEYTSGGWRAVIAASDIPLTLRGAARYNIANALGVAGLCKALGIEHDAIARGLTGFDARDNPGRGNLFDVGGVNVLVDFAHNPDAFRAIVELAANLDARRRLIAFGEAGDRTDSLIRDLARIAWKLAPDRVITLEIEKYARGRAPGEIASLLHEQLEREGARPEQITHHETEIEALVDALDWAEPGDLVIILSLAEQEAILARLRELTRAV